MPTMRTPSPSRPSSHTSPVRVGLLTRCALALSLLPWTSLPLQAAPDAGSLLQEIERSKPTPAPPKSPQLIQPQAADKKDSQARIVVTHFVFKDNTLIDSKTLEAALASYMNRPVSFTELQAAADAIVDYHAAQGWLVRTLLPKQDITNGVVTIQVIEAVFGKFQLTGSPKRVALQRIERIVQRQVQTGNALSLKDLERALLIADDLPGVSVSGRLVAGQEDNQTDVALAVTDEPLLYGEASLDNLGSRSTGDQRASLSAMLNSPMKQGDQLSLYAMHTQGIDFARLGLALPAGDTGLRVGLSASDLRYTIVQGFEGSGSATTVGINASYPLIRSRARNLNATLNLDQMRFDNLGVGGVTSTHYQVSNLSLGLSANLTDAWHSGGMSNASLTLTHGSVNLDGSPNQASDARTAQAQGAFNKWRYSLSRTQNLSEGTSLYGALTGQLANKNLDSSEKFYLGGPYGVRAYPNNEGGGSEGHLLSLELRRALPYNLLLSGFYDLGQVSVNTHNDFVGAANPNSLRYQGVGLSLAWSGPGNSNLKATWSRRLGDNPLPVLTTGNDQDGSKKQDRFWFNAALPF